MNKQVIRSLDTDHIPIEKLTALLETFGLKHSAKDLPAILERAESSESTNRELLLDLLEREVKGRNTRRRKRNYAAAHLPPDPKPIEMFDPSELDS